MKFEFLTIVTLLTGAFAQKPQQNQNFIIISEPCHISSGQDVICQHLRDRFYAVTDPKLVTASVQQARDILPGFTRRGCFENKSLPAIDRLLIRKWAEKQDLQE